MHHSRFTSRLLAICATALLSSLVDCTLAIGAEDVVSELKKSLTRLDQVEMRASVAETVTSTMAPNVPDDPAQLSTVILKRRGQKALLVQHFDSQKGYLGDTATLFEDGLLTYVQADVDKNHTTIDTSNMSVTINGEEVAGPNNRQEIQQVFAGLGNGAFVFGSLDVVSLAQYFETASIDPNKTPDGLVHLISKSNFGTVDAWVDPRFGYLPRKIRIEKTGTDLSLNREIRNINMNGDGVRFPKGRVTRLVWIANAIELARSNDIPFMRGLILVHEVHSKAGPVVTFTIKSQVETVNFDPNFDGTWLKIPINVPLHHTVTVSGAPHLPYEWNGSRAVPRIRSPSSGDTRGPLTTQPGSDSTTETKQVRSSATAFLVAANVVALAAILLFLYFKRRSSH